MLVSCNEIFKTRWRIKPNILRIYRYLFLMLHDFEILCFRWIHARLLPIFLLVITVGNCNWRGGAWNSVNVFRRYLLQTKAAEELSVYVGNKMQLFLAHFCWLLRLISIHLLSIELLNVLCIDCWTLEWI